MTPTHTARATAGLGRTAVRGVAVTLAGQWGRFLLQIVSTVLLARLLSPSDYGLVAMVTAIGGFAEVLRDMGLSQAAIQSRTLTDSQRSTLFWLNTAVGALIAAIVAALSPLIADFYGYQELVPIALSLAGTLFLGGLVAQHQADLNRRMRFASLAIADMATMAVAVVIALVLAWQGAGYWALVAMLITQAVIRVFVVFAYNPWRPGRPAPLRDIRSFLTFGGNLTGVNVLNYAARNADNVVIGKFLGDVALGLYSRAYLLLMLPLQQLNAPLARVALPVLSALQDDVSRYRAYLRTSALTIAYSALPVFAISGAVAEPAIRLALGEQWRSAADIFQILAFAGVAQSLGHLNGWIFTSLGRTGRQLAYATVSRPIVIASFFVGIPWGVQGVALAYTITSWLLLPIGFTWAVRGTGVRGMDLVAVCWRPGLLFVAIFTASTASVEALSDQRVWVQFALGALSGLAVLALSYFCLPPIRRDLKHLLSVFAKGFRAQPQSSVKANTSEGNRP